MGTARSPFSRRALTGLCFAKISAASCRDDPLCPSHYFPPANRAAQDFRGLRGVVSSFPERLIHKGDIRGNHDSGRAHAP